MKPIVCWCLRWNSESNLDGISRHFIFEKRLPALFRTREEARRYATEHWGYIKKRPDLRAEPHGWRMPTPIRVMIAPLMNNHEDRTDGSRD